MGRPIKKQFFGNLNTPPIGGEGINTVTVISSGTLYSQGATAVITSPQIPDGVAPSLTAGINNGGVTVVSVGTAGLGYTSTATVTITTASGVTKVSTGAASTTTITVANTSGIFIGMTITGNAGLGGAGDTARVVAVQGTSTVITNVANDATMTGVTLSFRDLGSGFAAITSLTNTRINSIRSTAFIPANDGGTAAREADIVKQESSRRYLVKTAEGTGQCRLVAVANASLVAGQMNILATDILGSTYYVTKLTARRATLSTATNNGGFEYASGAVSGWSLSTATTGTVSISNS
jgi:ribosomal protein S11